MAKQEEDERLAAIVGGAPLSAAERHRAYTAALQRDLNWHRRQLGASEMLVVDGEWDEQTEVAFRQICRVLGIAPERDLRTFRLIAGATAAFTDAEHARADSDGSNFEQELRERFEEVAEDRALSADEPESPDIDIDEDFDLLDPQYSEPPSGDVVVSVRFDPASWHMLQDLAHGEHVPVGSALGSAIQRMAFLERVAADGGQLIVKRGRRLYRLRPLGRH